MRIKVLLNLGRNLPRFLADEVHEVTDEVGLMLIANAWAVELPPEPVAIRPVTVAAEPDKFQQLRQHPDHVTTKKRSPRRRAENPTIQTETQGD